MSGDPVAPLMPKATPADTFERNNAQYRAYFGMVLDYDRQIELCPWWRPIRRARLVEERKWVKRQLYLLDLAARLNANQWRTSLTGLSSLSGGVPK